ncbi:hypothetical protein Srubr_19740 [Streptomyces rubradiris]|uniref:Uncharacterized protein n=1 Tax=Streptomyces rubradiris TaxID=285531 RepID=A0ABQ3R8F4_STRRR|nr:hypothetical protein GCM10018792_59480 [Streptomyces rubradiris]GHI52128.1 hypothetical protein Srubr_19740 [Streptomyces rubradiris]
MLVSTTSSDESTGRPVEIHQMQASDLRRPQRVDRDQSDDGLGHRGRRPIQQAGEAVGRNPSRCAIRVGDGDVAGRAPEDDPLSLQGPEQRSQGAVDAMSGIAGVRGDDVFDIFWCDLAEAVDPLAALPQDGNAVVGIAADGGPVHRRGGAAVSRAVFFGPG